MRGIPTVPFVKVAYVTKAFGSDLFDAAATSDSATVWTQPAGSILLRADYTLDVAFLGTGITDIDLELGDSGDHDGVIVPGAANLTSDPVGTVFGGGARGAYFDQTAGPLFQPAAKAWVGYAASVGANLSLLTAGQVTFRFVYLEF